MMTRTGNAQDEVGWSPVASFASVDATIGRLFPRYAAADLETCLSSYHHIVFELKTTEDTHNSQLAIMSLPRSDYDPRRVCLNPFPNFTLGKHKRTMGIYLAGGLVCLSNSQVSNAMIYLYVRHVCLLGSFIVCIGQLDVPGRRHPICTRALSTW